MKKITNQELTEIFLKFDNSLELDEEKLNEMSDKQKSELYLAVKKVLSYREDFPPDLAKAVQDLARQSVEKQSTEIQKGTSSLGLNPDEDGIVLEDGSIIEPSDELFPLAKKLDRMNAKEVEQFVDDLAKVVTFSAQKAMLKLLDRKLRIIEEKRKTKKTNDNKPKVKRNVLTGATLKEHDDTKEINPLTGQSQDVKDDDKPAWPSIG